VKCETLSKTLTDLHIWGYELHKNAFDGRAPPGPAGGAKTLPRSLAVIRSRGGREGE